MIALNGIHFKTWIDENRSLLKPPVGNKMVWSDGEFIVMVVGGPNQRKDFHVNPTPEFFYQVEGDMVLRLQRDNQVVDVPIREGEIYLLPSNVPHSPQRQANTVGLVIEQLRLNGGQDALQWYCDNCNNLLYEDRFVLQSVEKDFPPIFARYFGQEEHRTCKKCGTVMPAPNN
jgi:3-hydroxyanthranilate 3,4-dioxygenase